MTRILVAWRDDGFWILLLLACWFTLSKRRIRSHPLTGFVGQGSSSSLVIAREKSSMKSIRITRRPFTPGAPRWRLTYELVTPLPASLLRAGGSSSATSG